MKYLRERSTVIAALMLVASNILLVACIVAGSSPSDSNVRTAIFYIITIDIATTAVFTRDWYSRRKCNAA